MRVASLHVHPLKGGAIMDVEEAAALPDGLAGDRRWMVVDANGRFVSQRELPALARLTLEPDGDGGGATMAFGGERHRVTPSGGRADVTLWRDTVSVATMEAGANDVLSRWLGRAARLVRFDTASHRTTDPDFADAPVAFADGYPVLVVTAASLDALNGRIANGGGDPVPMARFRPNVVVEGATPWAEDGWRTIEVGGVTFDLVKPCARCTVTTVDQDRGERFGDEPLATLRALRMSADRRVPGVLFGWNAVARGTGTLRVGDGVRVVERRDAWPIKGRERVGAPAF